MNPNGQDFYSTVALQYAPVVAALLNFRNTPDYTGERYRATWNDNTQELKLFERGDNRPKLAVRYNPTLQQYEALPENSQPPTLTPTDIDNLEKLGVALKIEATQIGLERLKQQQQPE